MGISSSNNNIKTAENISEHLNKVNIKNPSKILTGGVFSLILSDNNKLYGSGGNAYG